jgi:phosphoribosylaminoimidazole-succinocarboxamide synthase
MAAGAIGDWPVTDNANRQGAASGSQPTDGQASYEGKAKLVQRRADGTAAIFFKDAATAGNGKKRADFPGKGALCCRISELLFGVVAAAGIPTHLLSRLDARTLLVRAAEIIPIEVVVRFQVAGTLAARTGLPLGSVCTPPICELYYKRDDLGDPLLNDEHVRLLGLATPAELATLRDLAQTIAQLLHQHLQRADIDLYDLKFEFGRVAGAILLADEISPDTCRFRDRHSGQVLDKDVFRLDLAELVPTYQEVLNRLERLPLPAAPFSEAR